MDKQITPEQAAFIDVKTKQYFDYTIDCFDSAKKEGNNVLQWLFAVITGGMIFLGAVWVKGFHSLAIGFAAAILAAAWAAAKLVRELRSRNMQAPGNLAAALEPLLEDTPPRMQWREAKGMDERIRKNVDQVRLISAAVDNARVQLIRIPFCFAVGIAAAYFSQYFFGLKI
jgi:hypothetical protein